MTTDQQLELQGKGIEREPAESDCIAAFHDGGKKGRTSVTRAAVGEPYDGIPGLESLGPRSALFRRFYECGGA